MRPIAKITAARLPLRKTAVGAAAVHRAFPAWIDAEQGIAFSALISPVVTSRVRAAGLVLRSVTSPRAKRIRSYSAALGKR